MLDKKKYNEYLEKKKNEKFSEQKLRFFEVLVGTVTQNGVYALSDLSEKDIGDFIKSFEWSLVEVQKAFDFLSDYVSFIQKEQLELNSLADIINQYCIKRFEAAGTEAALSRKKTILLIPDDAIVEPKHLEDLTNVQFVSAFKAMQKLVIKIYNDVEKSPFKWGYPDFYTTDGYYNRVIDFLFAFVLCGTHKNGELTINTKSYLNFTSIKRHKKPELMLSGFEKSGFNIYGFDKNSLLFTVTYLENPHIITVLNTYVRKLGDSVLHWSAGEMMKWSLSYRYIEDSSVQKYESEFLTKMDLSTDKLKEIQYWLYGEAEKYGFRIDVSHPYEKNCIQYKKGSKVFLLVGEKEIDGVPVIFSKVILRDVFEKEKEKFLALHHRFPDAFKSNCRLCNGIDQKCKMRISYEIEGKQHRNCAYNSFFFYNPTLNDVKEILELFVIENKI